ncbi:MAG: FAD-binding oxidoreductase, partial [Candidatus Marsarchaeota archaeon]|nr:FAD-binding oxidoreductase [Candidatus Marsarchaeota archaeon]
MDAEFFRALNRITKVIASKGELEKYEKDRSIFSGVMPMAVVVPKDAKEVSEVLSFCNRNSIHVTARGGGSSLTGSSVPLSRSIVMDMSRFDRVIEINVENRYAIVEPEVTIDELNRRLLRYNYFYPPDPASAAFATIGGTISTNAGGLRCVAYGSTKDWILGLEFVLADGAIVKSGGPVLKRSIGYDITGLMVGSEGTLGIVTRAILKIAPIPESTGVLIAFYSGLSDASKAISRLKVNGAPLLVAEFADAEALKFMEGYKGLSVPKGAKFMLLIEVMSSKESIGKKTNGTASILRGAGALSVVSATKRNEIDNIFNARRHLLTSMQEMAKAIGKKIMLTDIVVPTSEIKSMLPEIRDEMKKYGFEFAMYGHIGDGNVHSNVFVWP